MATLPVSRVVLYTREGCHLCEPARETVASVCADLAEGWTELSVDDDAELRADYGDLVPVVTVDGVQLDFWRIDETRLRRALSGPGGGAGAALDSLD